MASSAPWVAAQHRIDDLCPAFEADGLTVWAWVADLQARTSRPRDLGSRDADGKALATGHTVWACIDLISGRSVPVPADVVAAFEVGRGADPRLDVLGPTRRLLRRDT